MMLGFQVVFPAQMWRLQHVISQIIDKFSANPIILFFQENNYGSKLSR